MGRAGKPRQATMVHHIKPRKEYPELALCPENLESLCNLCHERLTPERRERNGEGRNENKRRIVTVRNEVERDDQ